ncbi:MAG TPA: hypothetical protein PLL77_00590 [Pyrinomonadaceae bacterium]|nr:hypothetical protein [Pyrinomonadaceae bacterium]
MTDNSTYRLIALRENPYFPAGTLFEFAGYTLPDRGDGVSIELDPAILLNCHPFAENVPPGQCPVQITSFSAGEPGDVRLDQTIHWQKLEVPIAPSAISSIDVLDRARDFEADHYEAPPGDEDLQYRLHIGHLRPGFYAAIFELADGETARLTFIKHFPESFAKRCVPIEPKTEKVMLPERSRLVETPKDETYFGFSAQLLNAALELTTEWGENFGKPIDERILAKYPQLTPDEIAALTKISREAEYFIYSLAERELAGEISETEIPQLAVKEHRWLNAQNTARLTGIGMFYARK